PWIARLTPGGSAAATPAGWSSPVTARCCRTSRTRPSSPRCSARTRPARRPSRSSRSTSSTSSDTHWKPNSTYRSVGSPPMTDVDTAQRSIDPEFASVLMADLLFARRASERFWNLQRQGRLSTVAPLTGQEAAVVGAVRALDLEHDWLVPYYRDVTGFGALGDEFFEQLVVYWRGHPDGGRIP